MPVESKTVISATDLRPGLRPTMTSPISPAMSRSVKGPDLEVSVFGLLGLDKAIEARLRPTPHADVPPFDDLVAGRQGALRHVTGADDRQRLRVGARHPLHRYGRRRPRPHDGVEAPVADGEREAGLGMRVDEDREDGRQIEALPVLLADRNPLARSGLGGFDVGGHRLPLTGVLVEHDVTLRFHDVPALAVHAVRLLDAGHVFGRRHQSHHVGATQDQGLAVAPALHGRFSIPISGDVQAALPRHALPLWLRRTNSPIPSFPSHWAPSTITWPRRNTFFTRPVTRRPSKRV